MRIAFRVDSSTLMGSGHAVRCLTLADELRRRGAAIDFVARLHDGHLISKLEEEGYTVHRLPPPANASSAREDYAVWLGVSQDTDAEQSLRVLSGHHYDWLVVDHYGLDHEWERRLRSCAGRILVIDDLANRRHDCDLLLDQNYFGSAGVADRYRGRVPDFCRLLLGPSYALLRPEYAQLRAVLPTRDGIVRRLLIFFGGSDRGNDTRRVLDALACPVMEEIAVDVVIGAGHADLEAIEAWVGHRRGAAVHSGLPSLAALMVRADLAVGGGGGTTWERACLSLPSVVATIADNQSVYSQTLAREGYQLLLGSSAGISVEDWCRTLVNVVNDPARLARMSARAGTLTDGYGAGRVASAVLSTGAAAVRLRNRSGDLQRAEDQYGVPVGYVYFEGGDDATVTEVRIEAPNTADAAASRRILLRLVRNRVGAAGYLALAQPLATPANPLRITVLSDATSWLNDDVCAVLGDWLERGYGVRWVHDPAELVRGDVCFLIGCSKLLEQAALNKHAHNLVVHESALPQGRGWSPMTWQVLEDRRHITVTLFEAAAQVDAGRIHLQTTIDLSGRELVEEWRQLQARATADLCTQWIETFPQVVHGATEQSGPSSSYPRRRPADSRLDPQRSLAEQFDLLRVVDNAHYPAYFDYRERRYRLLIEPGDAIRAGEHGEHQHARRES